MELLRCAQDKRQLLVTQCFLKDMGFKSLRLTERVGHRAAVYVEEYTLSHGLRAGDVIIAATASEHGLVLSRRGRAGLSR
jgi:predicted nucleic acid-binding protein